MVRRTTIEGGTSLAGVPGGARVTASTTMRTVFRPHKLMVPAGWALREVRCGLLGVGFTACPSDEPGLVNAYFVADAVMRPGDVFVVVVENVLDTEQDWLGFKVRGAEALAWESEGSDAV